ncbi:MAG: indole acetimide hydrolase, partial [Cohaesibacteraceae bacterium]|nr:indole acetimide hydrolase [Cohaesibacteraceae bacterium]
ETEKIIEAQLANLTRNGVTLVPVTMADIWQHNNAFSFTVVLYEVMRDLPDYLAEFAPDVSFKKLIEGIGSPDVTGAFSSQLGENAIPDAVYHEAMNSHRPAMRAIYNAVFEDHALDAIVFPTTPRTASKIGEDETVQLNGKSVPTFPTFIRNTDLGSNVGAPGITLPCHGNTGLPVGIELDGLAGQDTQLLQLGKRIEKLLCTDN